MEETLARVLSPGQAPEWELRIERMAVETHLQNDLVTQASAEAVLRENLSIPVWSLLSSMKWTPF